MKSIRLLLLLIFVTAGAFAQTSHQTYIQRSPNKIRVDQTNSKKILKEVEEGKAYLIDVRSPEEYNERHLKNSQNINIRSTDFAEKVALLDRSKKVYLYCRSGNRSGQATDSLITLGFGASYNIGGLDSIANKGYPIAK